MTLRETCEKAMVKDKWGVDPTVYGSNVFPPMLEEWRSREGLPMSEDAFRQSPLNVLLTWAYGAVKGSEFRAKALRFVNAIKADHITYNLMVPTNFDTPYPMQLRRKGQAAPNDYERSLYYQLREALDKIVNKEVYDPYTSKVFEFRGHRDKVIQENYVFRDNKVLYFKTRIFLSTLPFIIFAIFHKVPPFRSLWELLMNVTSLNKDQTEDIWKGAGLVIWPMMVGTVCLMIFLTFQQGDEWEYQCRHYDMDKAMKALFAVEFFFYFNLLFFWLPTLVLGWLVYMFVLILIAIVFVVFMSANNMLNKHK